MIIFPFCFHPNTLTNQREHIPAIKLPQWDHRTYKSMELILDSVPFVIPESDPAPHCKHPSGMPLLPRHPAPKFEFGLSFSKDDFHRAQICSEIYISFILRSLKLSGKTSICTHHFHPFNVNTRCVQKWR